MAGSICTNSPRCQSFRFVYTVCAHEQEYEFPCDHCDLPVEEPMTTRKLLRRLSSKILPKSNTSSSSSSLNSPIRTPTSASFVSCGRPEVVLVVEHGWCPTCEDYYKPLNLSNADIIANYWSRKNESGIFRPTNRQSGMIPGSHLLCGPSPSSREAPTCRAEVESLAFTLGKSPSDQRCEGALVLGQWGGEATAATEWAERLVADTMVWAENGGKQADSEAAPPPYRAYRAPAGRALQSSTSRPPVASAPTSPTKLSPHSSPLPSPTPSAKEELNRPYRPYRPSRGRHTASSPNLHTLPTSHNESSSSTPSEGESNGPCPPCWPYRPHRAFLSPLIESSSTTACEVTETEPTAPYQPTLRGGDGSRTRITRRARLAPILGLSSAAVHSGHPKNKSLPQLAPPRPAGPAPATSASAAPEQEPETTILLPRTYSVSPTPKSAPAAESGTTTLLLPRTYSPSPPPKSAPAAFHGRPHSRNSSTSNNNNNTNNPSESFPLTFYPLHDRLIASDSSCPDCDAAALRRHHARVARARAAAVAAAEAAETEAVRRRLRRRAAAAAAAMVIIPNSSREELSLRGAVQPLCYCSMPGGRENCVSCADRRASGVVLGTNHFL